MTVHVLIPVFNRLKETQRVLTCTRKQKLDEQLRIVVIDDGSSDGTGKYLDSQADISVLKGDGSLWWAGAIELGLQHALAQGGAQDWVLFVNNDTQFAENFIQGLLDAARVHAPAAVGSVICDEAMPRRLLSIGAMLNTWRLRVQDKLQVDRAQDAGNGLHSVDALSGRGTLYPLAAFRAVGTMNTAWLPHYLADYELSVRVRKAGYKLLVTEYTAILSADEYGNSYRPVGLRDKFFSIRSAYYLPAVLAFWWGASSFLEKLTLMPRLIFIGLKSRRSLV